MSYRIVRQLPGGAFSEIFEVEDPESAIAERLVLKRLNQEMSALPAVRTAFAEEAKLLRELKHPNIVTFRRCYFDERQRVCLVMEKVAGEPLDAWARRHASRPEQVLDLFERVLSAVDYLHHRSSPFLHLDLKPDNILVTSTPEGAQPVLIDFGIARRSGGQGLKAYTPPYGAPEQEEGRTLDCATDVYALGQMLVELLALVGASVGAAPRSAFAAVVEQATRRSRRERYAHAGAMRLAFRQARRQTGEPASRSAPRLRGPVPRWAWPAAAGAAVVLVGAIFFLHGGQNEPPQERDAAPPPVTVPVSVSNPGNPGSERERFSDLQYKFEQALIDGQPGAADYYEQARDLSDSLPQGSEHWRWMKSELDTMSNYLAQAQDGGPAGEEIKMLLIEKHSRVHP